MNVFDGIEKLINERGSAAILRERILLAKDQQLRLEQENAELKVENARLRSDLQQAQVKADALEKTHADNPLGYRCDHCGSAALKRTGNRPDPTFHDLGIKQAVFTCASCSRESAFTEEP